MRWHDRVWIFSMVCLFGLTACGGGSGPPLGSSVAVGFNAAVSGVLERPDSSGDIYVWGDFDRYRGTPVAPLIRLNDQGQRDATFQIAASLASQDVRQLVSAGDGSGDLYLWVNTGSDAIYRINDDGSIDVAFSLSGSFDGSLSGIASPPDASGDLYVVGSFENYGVQAAPHIIRFNGDGSVDSGFDAGSGFSIELVTEPGFSGTAVPLALAFHPSNGDLYVAGTFTHYRGTKMNGLVRINADGSRDTAFDTGSGFSSATGVAPQDMKRARDGSGDLYVVGVFDAFRGASTQGVVRINNDGTRDTGFDVGSGMSGSGVSGYARVVEPGSQSPWPVHVGGAFDTYRGATVDAYVNINADGSRLDADFQRRSLVGGLVSAILEPANGTGSFYLGGNIERYDGVRVNHLVRVLADGSIDNSFTTGY